MTIAYVKWKDALTEEHSYTDVHSLATLEEVGYLIAETPELVVLAMESPTSGVVNRWRLTIPRINILVMKTVDVEKAFNRKARTLINVEG